MTIIDKSVILTEEQKKLVEENHNLIYWYINEHNLELSEWYGLLAIELCYTIMKHNPERGSIGNYFKLRADGLVSREYHKGLAQKRYNESVSYIENVHNTQTAEIEDLVDLKDFMKGQNGEILRLKYEGYTQKEISEMVGVDQSYISKLLKKAKRLYHETNG